MFPKQLLKVKQINHLYDEIKYEITLNLTNYIIHNGYVFCISDVISIITLNDVDVNHILQIISF